MKKKFLAVNKDAQDKMKSERVPTRFVRVFLTSVLNLEATRQIIIEGRHTSRQTRVMANTPAVEESILGGNMASNPML
jgi:hypothetical protein